jgi:hypothetical protein
MTTYVAGVQWIENGERQTRPLPLLCMVFQSRKLEYVAPSAVWAMKGALARMRGSEMFNQVFVCRKLGVANTVASPSLYGQMVLCMLVEVLVIGKQSQTSAAAQYL